MWQLCYEHRNGMELILFYGTEGVTKTVSDGNFWISSTISSQMTKVELPLQMQNQEC